MQTRSKRAFAVIGIGLGVIVLGMMWSLVNTSLASIQRDLYASVLELQWMMNSYGICICVPLLTMGKLGDAYGRKKIFLYGLATALFATVIGGFATHIWQLIVCMGLFGLAGSMILPLSQALLVHQFPEQQKRTPVALWSTFTSVALASGPIVGGLILNWLPWNWIYWIPLPLIVASLAIVFFFVDHEKEFHKSHCDWVGVILLALIVGSLIMGIMQGHTWGWTSPLIIALFTLSLISLVIFVLLERKIETPLFRPDLFSKRSFLFSSIANGCTIGFLWVAIFIVPLYLQNMLQFSALSTGLSLLLITLPVGLFSVTVSEWYCKWGAKPLMLMGFVLFFLAFVLQAFVTPSHWTLGIGCLAIGIGWVLVWSPSISNALSSLPHAIAGIASGMFITLQELGGVLSLALAGVFFRISLQNDLLPHIDLIQSELGENFDSLRSNSAAVVELLGKDAPIVSWINQAFITGYQTTFQFLLGSCVVAILFTIFLPTKE